jgi:hypothetical protein
MCRQTQENVCTPESWTTYLPEAGEVEDSGNPWLQNVAVVSHPRQAGV